MEGRGGDDREEEDVEVKEEIEGVKEREEEVQEDGEGGGGE